MIPLPLPTHITVDQIRQLIADLPDDHRLCIQYNEVEDKYIFLRIDSLLVDSDPGGTNHLVLTVSLVSGDDEKSEYAGQHCPDDSCPGVIDDDGECSHCGSDYEDTLA